MDNIQITIYKKLSIEDFSQEFVSKDKLDTGSVNACVATMSASLFQRAVSNLPNDERSEFLKRNSEILRTYMIHLIDDDIKARNGYRKELLAGDKIKIEASIHTACKINEEIINMMRQMLELEIEAIEIIDSQFKHYIKESAEFAMSSIRSSIIWILNIVDFCSDETYKYVVKRENEISLEYCNDICTKILRF